MIPLNYQTALSFIKAVCKHSWVLSIGKKRPIVAFIGLLERCFFFDSIFKNIFKFITAVKRCF